MLRLIACTALVLVSGPEIAGAQSVPDHLYVTHVWKVRPGSEAAYDRAYREVVRPIWSQLRTRSDIVSFLELSMESGDTEDHSHMILVEFEDQEALDNYGDALDAASQEVFGRPYAEVSEERFAPLRDAVRSDTYRSPAASGM